MFDGHRLNQKSLKILCGDNKNFFFNPYKNDEKIFVNFDPVHTAKNIINCLTNKKTLTIPNPSSPAEIITVELRKFQEIYEK